MLLIGRDYSARRTKLLCDYVQLDSNITIYWSTFQSKARYNLVSAAKFTPRSQQTAMENGNAVAFEKSYILTTKPCSFNWNEHSMNNFRLDDSDLPELPELLLVWYDTFMASPLYLTIDKLDLSLKIISVAINEKPASQWDDCCAF